MIEYLRPSFQVRSLRQSAPQAEDDCPTFGLLTVFVVVASKMRELVV